MKPVKFDPGEIIRDQYGRPRINGKSYTRASNLSLAVESTFGLDEWKRRQVAVGMALREDLQALALSTTNKKDLDIVVENAMNAAESQRGANIGTAIHSLTEAIDLELPIPRGTPKKIRDALAIYKLLTDNMTIRVVETFVVCDEIMSAGTFDRIVEYKGNLYIADIKTGEDAPKYSHGASIQLAVYARGTPIINGDLYTKSLLDMGVNQRNAIMIHVPQSSPDKGGLYWIDIATGWAMAKVAYNVRQWWKSKPSKLFEPATREAVNA